MPKVCIRVNWINSIEYILFDPKNPPQQGSKIRTTESWPEEREIVEYSAECESYSVRGAIHSFRLRYILAGNPSLKGKDIPWGYSEITVDFANLSAKATWTDEKKNSGFHGRGTCTVFDNLLQDDQGQQLLSLLVSKLPSVVPNDPRTFISYKDVHVDLHLPLLGPTYGESLKNQGLNSLADWTASTGKPGITGMIIDREALMPGDGYFRLFGKPSDDFTWWIGEIQKSKSFDWLPFLMAAPIPLPPLASDITEPTERQETVIYRVLRDTALARQVKQLNNYRCQLCGHTIVLPNGDLYAEAHHIRPLGEPHNGPDVIDNIICLCPNHHAELDYGVRPLEMAAISIVPRHSVSKTYVRYHNEVIHKPLT